MNAYLPTLAKESPGVTEILDEIQRKHHSDSPSNALGNQDELEEHHASDLSADTQNEPLLPSAPSEEVAALKARYDNALSRATSRISSLGIALGYGAGILLLLVALVPVTKLQGSTFSLRLAIGLSGIWWAVFSIPAALWLPGSSSPGSRGDAPWLDEVEVDTAEWSFRREIVGAWKRLGSMLRWAEIKKLRNTFKYLAAWFLLSDGMYAHVFSALIDEATLISGFTTITSTAMLFGKTSLNMKPSALIIMGVIVPTSGILGSLLWPILQRRYGWTNLKVIVILVTMASAIPAYGCLGFLEVFQGSATRFGGLTTQGEMFGLAVYFGQKAHLCPLSICTERLFQGLSTGHFKDMPGLSTRSSCLLEKRQDGASSVCVNFRGYTSLTSRQVWLVLYH